MERTYFILRNTDYRPDGFIQLGQLIAEPRVPHRPIAPPLNPVPADLLQHSYRTNWSLEESSGSSGELGFIANLLTAITAKASINAAQENGGSWQAATLETTFLDLGEDDDSQEYVKHSVESTAVRKWLRGRFLTRVLYMVTGVKIARKPGQTSSEISGGSGSTMEFSADPGTGGLASLGLQGGLSRTKGFKESSTPSEDFVFAYRLRKVHISLFNKAALGDDVHGADLYRYGFVNGGSSSGGEEEELMKGDMELPVDIDDIDEVLVEDEDFGPSLPDSVEKREGVDEDGSRCWVVFAEQTS